MDQSLRNKLRGVVTQSRKLLEEAVAQVLQGQFGIYATGKKDEVAVEDAAGLGDLSADDRAFREQILVHLKHVQATGFAPQEKPTAPALVQMVREVAFTHLNRLCAYKMMEARGLIREAVSRGLKSNGFLYYLGSDGHEAEERLHASGQQFAAYRHFLEWLGGTLSEEIGVLFSPHDPANRLFPPQRVLEDVLEQINDPELKGIWSEDEAIGWVYQYFTPKEQRDEARKASAAPRNSYELAFRNQFFTPRYVVEFLTDNTLGRIWYDMRKGDTALKDRCRYMVRRPNEVFLSDGEAAPAETPTTDDGAARPISIPHRAKKDPRELKILDPACGSGHFLLYCFDLLLLIYLEAYDDPDLGPALKQDYATPEEFKRAIPGLILSRNLHGIDIDLRASQIAALALWLRAQKAYADFAIPKADRPKVTRSNFVCAEPMPGEEDMLREFLAELYPAVLGQLVRIVFDKMKLAGEAGSLLKIEAEIQGAVEEAHRQWLAEREQATDQKGNPLLFTRGEMNRLSKKPQTGSMFDILEISEQEFWTDAEGRVVEALRDYARRATNGKGLHRQLFADDAARGFAFVDVCRKRFDVVLMNPPFGTPTLSSSKYLQDNYEAAKHDLASSFIERGVALCHMDGRVGSITTRAPFFLSYLANWREDYVLKNTDVHCFADFGDGVLDAAMETAAHVMSSRTPTRGMSWFSKSVNDATRESDLLRAIQDTSRGLSSESVFFCDITTFSAIDRAPFAYSVSDAVRLLFKTLPSFETEDRKGYIGALTQDDFRFVRTWWEVDPQLGGRGWTAGTGKTWVPYAMGGGYSPFYSDFSLVLNWLNDGAELKLALSAYRRSMGFSDQWTSQLNAYEKYFTQGITWSSRPNPQGSFWALPKGCIFRHSSPAVLSSSADLFWLLGILNSRPYRAMLDLLMPRGATSGQSLKYELGYVRAVPIPFGDVRQRKAITDAVAAASSLLMQLDTTVETSHYFCSPFLISHAGAVSLRELCSQESASRNNVVSAVRDRCVAIEVVAEEAYGFLPELRSSLYENTAARSCSENLVLSAACLDPAHTDLVSDLLSWCVGLIWGRWDVQCERDRAIELTKYDAFSPLPICSPGMLVGTEGNPAIQPTPDYPLNIQWSAVLVDDPDHADDIVRRVREVLELIWKDRAHTIEKEACEILGVKELRDYFRKPGKGGFWDDHVARYTKSRRTAPIYWLLQSSKKSYAVWLYCHRLDKDTLFKLLVNTVEPKVKNADRELTDLRTRRTTATGKEIKALDRQIEKQDALVSELRDFEDKLRRAAELHLTPDLNDGVVLTIAPLRELVPWKEAKAYWEELIAGEYAWSSIGKQLREKGLVK